MNTIRTSITARAFGPVRVFRKGLAPGPQQGPRLAEYVDIGDLRGTQVVMTKATASGLLGLNFYRMEKLLVAKVINLVPELSRGHRTYVTLDPGTSLLEIYKNWVEERGMPVTHADFGLHRNVRRWCQVPTSEPFPEIVLEGVFQRLAEIGIFYRLEVNMFLALDPGNFETVLDWMDNRQSLARSRRAASSDNPISMKMFKTSLPAPFALAPRTCFHPGREHGNEPPSARIRRRLWCLDELYEPVCLYALVTAPRLRRPMQLREHVKVAERVEDVMRASARQQPWTKDDYEEELTKYVLEGHVRPQDSPAERDLTFRVWRMMCHRLYLYVKQVDPKGAIGLAPYIPPKIQISAAYRDAIREKFGNLRLEGRKRRKKDTHKALVELDRILSASENRRDEMKAFGDAYRAIIDGMKAKARFEDFGVLVPILDEKGELAGGMQKVWFRAWRVDDAWRSLGEDAGEDAARAIRERISGVTSISTGFVAEHLRTESIARSKPREPWMIGLDRLCVGHGAAELPSELKEERHTALRVNNLPGAGSVSTGIIRFERNNATLKKHGLLLGRHFVALEEGEYAIRLAFHLLTGVSQSFNRGQELRQQVLSDWTEIDGVGDEEPWHTQPVWPKVPRRQDLAKTPKVPLVLREETLNEALDLCELHMRRHGFTSFPTMPAAEDLKWKCGPGEYVISTAGKPLTGKDCIYILRYLLAGWPQYTLHDFRHVMAEDAALDHVPAALVAIMLAQETEEVTLHYMDLPPWAQAIVKAEKLDKRIAKQDKRLAGAKQGGISA